MKLFKLAKIILIVLLFSGCRFQDEYFKPKITHYNANSIISPQKCSNDMGVATLGRRKQQVSIGFWGRFVLGL